MELPSIREYEEVSAVLAEKIDRWAAEILEQGIEQGIEPHRVLLHRLAERRFGPAAAERLSAVLAEVTDAGRLAEAGEWIVDCATARPNDRACAATATTAARRPPSATPSCSTVAVGDPRGERVVDTEHVAEQTNPPT